METTRRLTHLQMELLKSFNFEVEDEQLLEIRQLLIEYLAEKVSPDIDLLFAEKNWGEAKIQDWSEEHMRIPYDKNGE